MFSVIYFFFYIKLACILEWVCSNLKKKKKKKKNWEGIPFDLHENHSDKVFQITKKY